MKESIKKQLIDAKNDYSEIGGWESIKSEVWLLKIIEKSFASYIENANVKYFQNKYKTNDKDKLTEKLISVTARNTAILGGITGATISADEIAAIVTGGEGGVGLPANIAIAATSVGAETILLLRFQLQLVANLSKIHNVPLDPNDPEDILTILAFAIGGSLAEEAGKFGMKVGGGVAKNVVKTQINKETLAALKNFAAKAGVTISQRKIINYAVPLVSIGIGIGWNYVTTRTIGKIAVKQFQQRAGEQFS